MTTILAHQGVAIEPTFARLDNPFNEIDWQHADAVITNSKGEKVFEQQAIEAPATWSQTAVNIVASKYFHGSGEERESSAWKLIDRVVSKIRNAGELAGYFQTSEDAEVFSRDLSFLLVNQYASFNSPVWFNVGVDRLEPNSKAESWHWNPAKSTIEHAATGYRHPQCSACFINSVEDSMRSILNLAVTEGMLFKFGSGTGSNLSAIRGAQEQLSGGGQASGPLSFMKGFDAFAGVIKSGGKTRRAAKMVILNADHPDIEEFIECKGKEEAKAHALVREGYDGSGPDSEAYSSIFFQNANNSVRATDEFMQAAINGDDWNLTARRDGSVTKTIKAADLLHKIADQTWQCGDPGMQFDSTINRWHTVKASGRINASNPCSEFVFLDDSSCNLASINLVKFIDENGNFNIEAFEAAVRLLIIAMDIIVDMAGYPTEKIARNSHDFRPLGLGFANLGAMLLQQGLAYDSDEGRNVAAAITAIMSGMAYKTSAELAQSLTLLVPAGEFASQPTTGAFPGFAVNETSFREVMALHLKAAKDLYNRFPSPMTDEAEVIWRTVVDSDLADAGFRNAQVTLLAPTGTIGFMMDCDTTGIEPMLALAAGKKLVGGGYMTLTAKGVKAALVKLGYTTEQVEAIDAYVVEHGTVEGAPEFRSEHLAVFDTAFRPAKGTRSIAWRGHIGMMAAVQPFLSGAISKTVNLPAEATVEEIEAAYIESWRQGLKAVAIYRDGSKVAQPMAAVTRNSNSNAGPAVPTAPEPAGKPILSGPPVATRHRLPNERASITHKFQIGGYEGYITVGLYPNGQPGEVFMRMSKEGSTISGLMDSWASQVSIALQHGVPLSTITSKMVHTRFEPSGWTGGEEFGFATSIMDYIGRWLDHRFGEGRQLDLFNNHAPLANGGSASAVVPVYVPVYVPPVPVDEEVSMTDLVDHKREDAAIDFADAPLCASCGGQMRPTGKCWSCTSCGSSNGGCS